MPRWNGGKLDRARLLADFVLRVQEVEDLLGGAQRLLEVVVELPELPHRLVKLENRDDEGDEEAFAEVCRA